MTVYMMELEEAAKPFAIRIEGPVDAGEREGTMQALKALRAELEKRGSKLEIVADEWCNTLEDIKYFAGNPLYEYYNHSFHDYFCDFNLYTCCLSNRDVSEKP